ncbi:MAG: hypothetical protein ACO2PP_22065 [Thermocrinis sp.]|uniref:hypothetical protein n=1 Tax=Thermocrinis sp. TaxID=2024383 RepID=UPI003BFCDA31
MAIYLLIILSLLIYFFNLGAFQVWQPNEAFFADASRCMLRNIIMDQAPEKGSIVVFELGSFNRCTPLKTFELYKGSESRLFKFMLDTKRKKNFSQFGVCLYF